jgi:hypothetical protein
LKWDDGLWTALHALGLNKLVICLHDRAVGLRSGCLSEVGFSLVVLSEQCATGLKRWVTGLKK